MGGSSGRPSTRPRSVPSLLPAFRAGLPSSRTFKTRPSCTASKSAGRSSLFPLAPSGASVSLSLSTSLLPTLPPFKPEQSTPAPLPLPPQPLQPLQPQQPLHPPLPLPPLLLPIQRQPPIQRTQDYDVGTRTQQDADADARKTDKSARM